MELHIEAVQYTVGLEPVLITYTGLGVTKGPLARSSNCHTTQAALAELSGVPGKWGDEEIIAVVEAEVAEAGVPGAVVKIPEPLKEQPGKVFTEEELAVLKQADEIRGQG